MSRDNHEHLHQQFYWFSVLLIELSTHTCTHAHTRTSSQGLVMLFHLMRQLPSSSTTETVFWSWWKRTERERGGEEGKEDKEDIRQWWKRTKRKKTKWKENMVVEIKWRLRIKDRKEELSQSLCVRVCVSWPLNSLALWVVIHPLWPGCWFIYFHDSGLSAFKKVI